MNPSATLEVAASLHRDVAEFFKRMEERSKEANAAVVLHMNLRRRACEEAMSRVSFAAHEFHKTFVTNGWTHGSGYVPSVEDLSTTLTALVGMLSRGTSYTQSMGRLQVVLAFNPYSGGRYTVEFQVVSQRVS